MAALALAVAGGGGARGQAGAVGDAGSAGNAGSLLGVGVVGRAGEAPRVTEASERLWQLRNLGKALYENPTTQAQAVEALGKALALAPGSARERLNYGLALLRAGRTAEGTAELEKVQKQAPELPQTWFNLGIAWKRASDYGRAAAQLEQMVRLVPDEPVSHYNLGVLYKLQGKPEKSLAEFETAARLGPRLAGPHFQLFNAYRAAGRAADAARELAVFQEIKKAAVGAAVPEDLEWSAYAELYDPPADRLAAGESGAAAPRPLSFAPRELARGLDPATAGLLALDVDGDGHPALLAWSAAGIRLWRPGGPGGAAGSAGPSGAGGSGAAAPVRGLQDVRGVVDVAAADFNNDGLPDLCVVTAEGARLYVNQGGGRFAASPARLPAGHFRRAVWVDFDHDYDLDLILLGDTAALVRNDGAAGWSDHTADFPFVPGRAVAAVAFDLVADGQGNDLLVSYADRPGVLYHDLLAGHYQAEPLPELPAGTAALAAYDLDGDGWTDVVASAPPAAAGAVGGTVGAAAPSVGALVLWNRGGVLSRGGAEAGGQAALAASAAAGTGSPPAAVPGPAVPSRSVPTAGSAGPASSASPASSAPLAAPAPLAVADLGNRAAPDLVTGAGIERWQAGPGGRAGAFQPAVPLPAGLTSGAGQPPPARTGTRAPSPAGPAMAPAAAGPPWVAAVAADFDRDGREDLAVVRADGTLVLLRNTSEPAGRWLEVALNGVRNPRLAEGARVEVKAGTVYQKKLYHGVPLLFGLRGRERADTVRITWPNGLIQNETAQQAAAAPGEVRAYKEAQRLSGSCPMIFAWNGRRFEFITDVLGVAPLGASSGDGQFFPVDHDEWVWVRGESLAPLTPAISPAAALPASDLVPAPLAPSPPASPAAGPSYEVRITEELREVSYLDRVRLLAVDHPAAVEVFTNEKFKSPPFPEFRLFGVEKRLRPVRAVDGNGRNVLPALLARDGVYAEGFRHTLSGVAETHTLELDFGPGAAPDNRAVLLLSGWVDWADGSTFRAASQESAAGLMLPRLEVRDAAGRWQVAVADMGIPAGKPKTIAVDLTGKFLSASREVRIVTNLCVYWDEIFLGESSAAPPVRLTPLPMAAAELRFRGFSRPVIDAARRQPEEFDYSQWMPVSSWNPTPGLYTRYGDVRALLADVDDELTILGSGDEVRLRFGGGALPPLPAGWRRDFLLDVDGWAKDADANTAFGQSVEPLPFHAMSAYPYPAGEHFPDDAEHRRWRETYNRRPALRLMRSLAAPPTPPAPPAPTAAPGARHEVREHGVGL